MKLKAWLNRNYYSIVFGIIAASFIIFALYVGSLGSVAEVEGKSFDTPGQWETGPKGDVSKLYCFSNGAYAGGVSYQDDKWSQPWWNAWDGDKLLCSFLNEDSAKLYIEKKTVENGLCKQ